MYNFLDSDESDEEIIVLNKDGKQVEKKLSKFHIVVIHFHNIF